MSQQNPAAASAAAESESTAAPQAAAESGPGPNPAAASAAAESDANTAAAAAAESNVNPAAASAAAESDSTASGETADSEDSEDSEDLDSALPFSDLLEVRTPPEPGGLAIGQRVRGKIISIGDDQVIISLSGRPDAILPTQELRGPDSTLLLRVDDPVSAIVQSVGLPAQLTLGKKRGLLNLHKLRVAHEQKQPVTGTIRAVNKGGFEVRVHGARGFCPLSQIDFGYAQEPQAYVGQTFRFRLLRWENGGRNIVLSRRAILKEEAESQAIETRRRLEVGAEFEGIVRRVQPFGAFVDIGGLEGLLHVSRMGRGHVTDPAHVVSPGQTLKVRVTRIDNPDTGKERIALAAADLGPDPWETARESLAEGAVVRGKVVRLAEFGAFVNLLPGIDGLVHVSELPPKPDDAPGPLAVQPGDEIEVRIVRIDFEKKRVSLSTRLQPPAPRPQREVREARDGREPREGRDSRRPRRERDHRDRERERETSPFSTGGSLTHNMSEQLGALRRKLQVRP